MLIYACPLTNDDLAEFCVERANVLTDGVMLFLLYPNYPLFPLAVRILNLPKQEDEVTYGVIIRFTPLWLLRIIWPGTFAYNREQKKSMQTKIIRLLQDILSETWYNASIKKPAMIFPQLEPISVLA